MTQHLDPAIRDLCRRLADAAAHMEQGHAVFCPALLLAARRALSAPNGGWWPMTPHLAKPTDPQPGGAA